MELASIARAATAVEACAEQLRARILGGEIEPGAKLPPERDLAAKLGVDRGTVRGALQRLVAAGLLVQRQGRGTVVQDYRAVGGPDLLGPLLDSARGPALLSLVEDLLLLRRHLAAAVLERLQGGVARADLGDVARAVDAFAAVVAARDDGDAADADVSAADLAVLAAVVRATRRPALMLCLNPVAAVLPRVPVLRDAIVARAADSVVAWRLLLAWLERPHPAGAAAILNALAARDRDTLARVARHLGLPPSSPSSKRSFR